MGVLWAGFAVLSELALLSTRNDEREIVFARRGCHNWSRSLLSAVVLGMPYENWQVGIFAFAAGCLSAACREHVCRLDLSTMLNELRLSDSTMKATPHAAAGAR